MPLNVLITHNAMAHYTGSELYARDVAFSLKNRGHGPVIYSQALGRLSADIQAAGIPVVNDLRRLIVVPDIIHGQHNLETMTALCQFPETPAVFICHGYYGWQGHPPLFPRILRYLAVDQPCLDRLWENGVPADRAEILLNFVDLQRFLSRGPLPPVPRKALVFSNYMNEQTGLPIVLKACRLAGMEGKVAGRRSGFPCYEPEKLLPEYDIVFAKGRAALEALAVGCAVITCDSTGLGSLVTTQNYESLRLLNFGFRTLTRPLTVDGILGEIRKYDPGDAQEVSKRVHQEADREKAVDRLVACYRSVIEEFRKMTLSRETEARALAEYLKWVDRLLKKSVEEHVGVLAILEAIYQSNSWKVTKPFRKTKDLFEYFKRQAHVWLKKRVGNFA